MRLKVKIKIIFNNSFTAKPPPTFPHTYQKQLLIKCKIVHNKCIKIDLNDGIADDQEIRRNQGCRVGEAAN